VDQWKKKCSASLTIDSKTQEILKVNGCSWDGETPLSEFHDHPSLSSAEVQKCFIKRDLLEQASTSSGPIPRLFEAKGSELAAAGHSLEDIVEILPQNNSKLLAQATKIGGDGTFKTRPKIYEQLYILMTWHKGVCQPAAFCLLGI